jgi:hypothetical protein
MIRQIVLDVNEKSNTCTRLLLEDMIHSPSHWTRAMSRIAFLVALAVGAPAFADDPLPGENLFPLTIGNVWTYKVSGQDDRFIVRAVRQEMVGEQTCVLLEASLKDRVVATEHLAFTKTGLCRFRVDKEDVDPPVCVLRTPLPGNRSWGTGKKEFHVGPRSGVARFSAKLEEITVGTKKYKTTAIHSDFTEFGRTTSSSDTWYAEGVGIVRQEIKEGKRTPLILELDKFESAKGE